MDGLKEEEEEEEEEGDMKSEKTSGGIMTDGREKMFCDQDLTWVSGKWWGEKRREEQEEDT